MRGSVSEADLIKSYTAALKDISRGIMLADYRTRTVKTLYVSPDGGPLSQREGKTVSFEDFIEGAKRKVYKPDFDRLLSLFTSGRLKKRVYNLENIRAVSDKGKPVYIVAIIINVGDHGTLICTVDVSYRYFGYKASEPGGFIEMPERKGISLCLYNASAAEVINGFGFDMLPKDFLDKTLSGRYSDMMLVHPDDVALVRSFNRSIAGGAPVGVAAARIMMSEGQYHWCRLAVSRVGAGAELICVGVMFDIDNTRMGMTRGYHQFIDKTADIMTEGIICLTEAESGGFEISYISRSACRYFGVSAGDDEDYETVFERAKEAARAVLGRERLAELAGGDSAEFTAADGSHVSVTSRRSDSGGAPLYYLLVRGRTAVGDTFPEIDKSARMITERDSDTLILDYDLETDIMLLAYNEDGVWQRIRYDGFRLGVYENSLLSCESRERFISALDSTLSGSDIDDFRISVAFAGRAAQWYLIKMSGIHKDGAVRRVICRAVNIQRQTEADEIRLRREMALRRALIGDSQLTVGFDTVTGAKLELDDETIPSALGSPSTLSELGVALAKITVKEDIATIREIWRRVTDPGTVSGVERNIIRSRLLGMAGGSEPRPFRFTCVNTSDFISGHKLLFIFAAETDEMPAPQAEAETPPAEAPQEAHDQAEEDVRHDVEIRTFGHFEVLVDGRTVSFRHEKSKELLALLTDRRGAYVSSLEAISCLWENEPADKTVLSRLRKTAFRLKEILEENGIGDIIEVSQNHSRRLNVSRVKCDLYDFLSGDPKYRSLFAGMYMLDYSWAEVTTAGLLGMEGKLHSEGGDK